MKTEEELNDGKRPKKLIKDNYALVTIRVDERICLEIYANNKSMGRIALRDGDQTIGSGVVT
jgi:translation elongation factor EF-1alpha